MLSDALINKLLYKNQDSIIHYTHGEMIFIYKPYNLVIKHQVG